MSVSNKDPQNLRTANTQWENLVKLYEDVYTKKNEGICVIFGEPFFEQDTNGVYVRGAKGLINIKAECLGCKKVYVADGTNLNQSLEWHSKVCEESKKNYAAYVATRESIPKIYPVSKEDLKKENVMLKEELEKVKGMERALKKENRELKHENDVLRRNNDRFQHEMLKRSGTSYAMYDVPNRRPGLVKVYQMMFEDTEKNKNLMVGLKETSKKLKGFFEGFGFVFDSIEVPSTEMLTKEVNDLVKKDLSEYQSIFVFVMSHGSYDRTGDVEHKSKEIQKLRKSLTDCDFLLDKPKVLVIEQCQTL